MIAHIRHDGGRVTCFEIEGYGVDPTGEHGRRVLLKRKKDGGSVPVRPGSGTKISIMTDSGLEIECFS